MNEYLFRRDIHFCIREVLRGNVAVFIKSAAAFQSERRRVWLIRRGDFRKARGDFEKRRGVYLHSPWRLLWFAAAFMLIRRGVFPPPFGRETKRAPSCWFSKLGALIMMGVGFVSG